MGKVTTKSKKKKGRKTKKQDNIQIYFHNHAAHTHSLYKSLFEQPPEGYSFVNYPKSSGAHGAQTLNKKKWFWSLNLKLIKKLINTNELRDRLFARKRIDEPLIYSSGSLVRNNHPWVCDFEYASAFFGYDNKYFLKHKKRVQKILESDNCKAILPWNKWGAKTLLSSIDSDIVRKKIHVVPVAIAAPELIKKKANRSKKKAKQANPIKVTLLFIGSANLPQDFYHKGGKAVFRIYKEVKKFCDVKLIVRCKIPQELGEWIKPFRDDPDVEIYEDVLKKEAFEELFARADMLVSPTISTPILVYLDAMAQQIPVVTTSAWANEEIVFHKKTGLIVEKPDIKYYEKDMLPYNMWYWDKVVKHFDEDEKFIQRFAKAVIELVKDPALRGKMGQAGRKEITQGKFSIAQRNKRLKEIFDKAVSNR